VVLVGRDLPSLHHSMKTGLWNRRPLEVEEMNLMMDKVGSFGY
jgi:hypothetical protein